MRREWRWLLVAVAAIAVAALGAERYAKLAAPCYTVAARWITEGRPWEVISIVVAPNRSAPGAILKLTGTVRERSADSRPAALLVSKLQVAAVVESPVIFWTLLLVWPATSHRERWSVLVLGIPMFMCLETATTVCQLLNPLSYASAVLAGVPDPVTSWERWSRFLEAGGRVALALAAALTTINLVQFAGRPYGNIDGAERKLAA